MAHAPLIFLPLEEVIQRYGDMVYRLAMASMRHPTDADDVFQDVFLRYAEKAPAFNDEEHRKAWLIRVTVNRCRSFYRSNWFRRIAPLEEAVHAAQEAPAEPALAEALQRLPQRYRTVLFLYYFENYDSAEIAAMTGQHASTVRSLLTRARKALAKQLEGDGSYEGQIQAPVQHHPRG